MLLTVSMEVITSPIAFELVVVNICEMCLKCLDFYEFEYLQIMVIFGGFWSE